MRVFMRKERQLMPEKKVCPCCCEKHTARSEEEKKNADQPSETY